jgi:hypothetical protein
MRAARAPAIPVVRLVERAIERFRMDVVDVAAVRHEDSSPGQSTFDEPVEEVADVLAVVEAGEPQICRRMQ